MLLKIEHQTKINEEQKTIIIEQYIKLSIMHMNITILLLWHIQKSAPLRVYTTSIMPYGFMPMIRDHH